ncbi:MAG: Chemotaxis regulator - transmits chemoreceptor signals to flagellar motor components CheY, partial [uncultured Gemmatimonadetes bacterium]
ECFRSYLRRRHLHADHARRHPHGCGLPGGRRGRERHGGRRALPPPQAGPGDHGHRDAPDGRHRRRARDPQGARGGPHPHVQRHGAAGAGDGSHPGRRARLRGEAVPALARAGSGEAGGGM